MRNKKIRYFLFGSILSDKKIYQVNDIDILMIYNLDSKKIISQRIKKIRTYILKIYKQKAHITVLNIDEYNYLKKKIYNLFKIKEFSLKEIKKILDSKL